MKIEYSNIIHFSLVAILSVVITEYLMRMFFGEQSGLLPSKFLTSLILWINYAFYKFGYWFANMMDIVFIFDKILYYFKKLYKNIREFLLKILIKFRKILRYTPLYDLLKLIYIILDLFKIVYNFSLGYSKYLKSILEYRSILVKFFSFLLLGIFIYLTLVPFIRSWLVCDFY